MANDGVRFEESKERWPKSFTTKDYFANEEQVLFPPSEDIRHENNDYWCRMCDSLVHFELESNCYFLTYDSTCHNRMLWSHFYQPHVAHFDKPLILFNLLWQVSQLEMHVSVCVTHRPLFPVTFHLSRYIGVRYLPPALSLCGVLMSWESWQPLHICGLPVILLGVRQQSPVQAHLVFP